MTDREKMICSIERCICRVPGACSCRDCNYNNYEYNECVEKLLQDALKLLKKQEKIKITDLFRQFVDDVKTLTEETSVQEWKDDEVR